VADATVAQGAGGLANAAKRALTCGRPHAVRDLADLIERIGPAVDAPKAVDLKPAFAA
jgi:UDP-N-acetylglucosamine--N-acetylmuramyl-(pentapeptide) pyrophosphoryl-undecaprenol N-acetylglucosamine transferase